MKHNHNSCKNNEFTADEMVRVTVEMSDLILLHCYCSECKKVQVLDVSGEWDIKYRKMLRRMFVRQEIISVPDEIFDERRDSEDPIHDYLILFHEDLQRLPDDLVAHRELQDDWEEVLQYRV